MDTLFFKQWRVEAAIGLLPWELTSRQVILLDVVWKIEVAPAAKTDDIADTVDYAAVRHSILALLAERRFGLIEALAEAIADVLLSEFHVAYAQVTVTKPHIFADMAGVGVVIERYAHNALE